MVSKVARVLEAMIQEISTEGGQESSAEPPTEEDDGNNTVQYFQPQKAVSSSNPPTPSLFPPLEGYLGIQNNRAFIHASSGDQDAKAAEREEGEWSDVGNNVNVFGRNAATKKKVDIDASKYKGESDENQHDFVRNSEHTYCKLLGSVLKEVGDASIEVKSRALFGQENSRSLDSNSRRYVNVDNMGETLLVLRSKEIRGIEGSYASRIVANHGKNSRLDEHKEAMLGKKNEPGRLFLLMLKIQNKHVL